MTNDDIGNNRLPNILSSFAHDLLKIDQVLFDAMLQRRLALFISFIINDNKVIYK